MILPIETAMIALINGYKMPEHSEILTKPWLLWLAIKLIWKNKGVYLSKKLRFLQKNKAFYFMKFQL